MREGTKTYPQVRSFKCDDSAEDLRQRTMAPIKEKQASNVFIRDDVYGWRPAVQEKINGDKAIVTVPEYPSELAMACDGGRAAKKGQQRTINLKDYPSGVLPLQNVDANGNLVECADMVKLPYLHEVSRL